MNAKDKSRHDYIAGINRVMDYIAEVRNDIKHVLTLKISLFTFGFLFLF